MRNSDNRPRRFRPSIEPPFPEESPHDYTGADIKPAPDGKVLVTAPNMKYYERWLYKQQDPWRYQYVYRIEQLRGLHNITVLIIGGGNPQLLTPEFEAYVRHSDITIERELYDQ